MCEGYVSMVPCGVETHDNEGTTLADRNIEIHIG